MADNPTRRAALAKLGLGLATSTSLAAAAAIAAPEAAVSPELLRLIEAHRTAYAAYKEAFARSESAKKRYDAARPPWNFPIKDIYGEPNCRKLSMLHGPEGCKTRFLENLDWREDTIRAIGEDFATPKRQKQLKAAFRAIKKDGLAMIDASFAQDEAARIASGYDAAHRAESWALQESDDALLAICSYRCRSLAEMRLKGDYLASENPGIEEMEEHVKALLQSSSVEA